MTIGEVSQKWDCIILPETILINAHSVKNYLRIECVVRDARSTQIPSFSDSITQMESTSHNTMKPATPMCSCQCSCVSSAIICYLLMIYFPWWSGLLLLLSLGLSCFYGWKKFSHWTCHSSMRTTLFWWKMQDRGCSIWKWETEGKEKSMAQERAFNI